MLTVTNMDATVSFYCDILGFTCLNRMESQLLISAPSIE